MPVTSQIGSKYHQEHKLGVQEETVGLKGVILPSASNESIQQTLPTSAEDFNVWSIKAWSKPRSLMQLAFPLYPVRVFEPGFCYVTKFLARSDTSWLPPPKWSLSRPSSFMCRNDGHSSFALQATAWYWQYKITFQCSSNLDTLQWCVSLLSTLSYQVPFLDINKFVKF